jgi:AcrR family transcriptional regulator
MQCGTAGYRCQEDTATKVNSPTNQQPPENGEETEVRARILDAAFAVFTKRGFAASSMLEIANRAQVSKRDLYALVGNKQQMLISCIGARARRMQSPTDLPKPSDREGLTEVLASVGTQLVREISDPAAVAVFRLAIAEAVHTPAVAQMLDSIGREAARVALRRIMTQAQSSGLLNGSPAKLADQFGGLLWGTLMLSLLLGVAERPSPREIAARARESAELFLRLHMPPS